MSVAVPRAPKTVMRCASSALAVDVAAGGAVWREVVACTLRNVSSGVLRPGAAGAGFDCRAAKVANRDGRGVSACAVAGCAVVGAGDLLFAGAVLAATAFLRCATAARNALTLLATLELVCW